MRSTFLFGALALIAPVFLVFGLGTRMAGRSLYGPGMMGGYGYGMGPWMMGPYGFGPGGMMAPYRANQTLNLSVDDVRNEFERYLSWQGNGRVKLGPVSEKNVDTIIVDIVTADKDGLVQRFAVNRHNGATQPSDD